MQIRFVQEIDFSGCKTPKEFGEQLSRPTARARLGEDVTIKDLDSFRRAAIHLLVDTDHEFEMSAEEWEEAYAAWVTAVRRRWG
jgi:hypothetical protein